MTAAPIVLVAVTFVCAAVHVSFLTSSVHANKQVILSKVASSQVLADGNDIGSPLTAQFVLEIMGALSPGVKRPGLDADHSLPSSTEVKYVGSYTSTIQ
jgi:hypothetical protein